MLVILLFRLTDVGIYFSVSFKFFSGKVSEHFNMAAVDGIDITPEKNGGVLKKILVEGVGEHHPSKGDSVYVHYVGTLENGEQFDSSRDRSEPFNFTLGNGQVIKGWDLGVASMKKGEKCDLICRADYAYGENGSPPKIPGGATLKFEIELLSWQGEDISPDRDGTITRSIIVEGEKYSSPTEGSTVKVCAIGSYNGRVFYDKEVNFILGEGSEVGLPEGVDRALRRFNKGEKSTIHLKGSRFTFGTAPPPEYNLPPHAEIDFTRIIELLEYEKPTEDEAKSRRDALLLAGYLNSALVYSKQNETVECIKNCDKALEVDPKCVKALYRKALALQEQNDVDEAIIEYKKVLEYEPDNKAAAAQILACKKKLAQIREKEKKRYKGMFEKFAAKEKIEVNEDAESTPMETSSPKSEMVN
uniref:peptidylprolyl isomerase n=1 Tax=Onchocerca volvulus TaxID=6282 RepID=A0A8R1XZE7_ONCVO